MCVWPSNEWVPCIKLPISHVHKTNVATIYTQNKRQLVFANSHTGNSEDTKISERRDAHWTHTTNTCSQTGWLSARDSKQELDACRNVLIVVICLVCASEDVRETKDRNIKGRVCVAKRILRRKQILYENFPEVPLSSVALRPYMSRRQS